MDWLGAYLLRFSRPLRFLRSGLSSYLVNQPHSWLRVYNHWVTSNINLTTENRNKTLILFTTSGEQKNKVVARQLSILSETLLPNRQVKEKVATLEELKSLVIVGNREQGMEFRRWWWIVCVYMCTYLT